MKIGEIHERYRMICRMARFQPFRYRYEQIAKGASVNLGAIAMSLHNGTHADARFHFDINGASIEKASLKIYLGRGTVVDLSESFFNRRRNT